MPLLSWDSQYCSLRPDTSGVFMGGLGAELPFSLPAWSGMAAGGQCLKVHPDLLVGSSKGQDETKAPCGALRGKKDLEDSGTGIRNFLLLGCDTVVSSTHCSSLGSLWAHHPVGCRQYDGSVSDLVSLVSQGQAGEDPILCLC